MWVPGPANRDSQGKDVPYEWTKIHCTSAKMIARANCNIAEQDRELHHPTSNILCRRSQNAVMRSEGFNRRNFRTFRSLTRKSTQHRILKRMRNWTPVNVGIDIKIEQRRQSFTRSGAAFSTVAAYVLMLLHSQNGELTRNLY